MGGGLFSILSYVVFDDVFHDRRYIQLFKILLSILLADDYLWFCFYNCNLCYIFHGRTNYSLVIICLPFLGSWSLHILKNGKIYCWRMIVYIFVLHAQSWNIVFYANLLQQTLSCELLWKKVQSHRLADWSYCWKQTELTPSCRNIFGEGDDRQDEYRIVVFIGTGFIVRCRLQAGCVLAPFVSLGSTKSIFIQRSVIVFP